MTHALRVLLEHIVDYAGLFPPADLDMRTAAQNYADYASGADAWALARFVVPLGRVAELVRERGALARATGLADRWRLSVLVSGDVAAELPKVRSANARHGALATIDCLELKLDQPSAIAAAGEAVRGQFETFVEIPVREDPADLIRAIGAAGLKAKIRTGGTTADAFPQSVEVARFMRRCFEAGVAFKATAGLHHPLRGAYRLTYAAGAPCSTMFGFLNVFLAAAALREGAADDEMRSILECDVQVGAFHDVGVNVLGRQISAPSLRVTRSRFATTFGSCSFTEPMGDLRAMGLL